MVRISKWLALINFVLTSITGGLLSARTRSLSKGCDRGEGLSVEEPADALAEVSPPGRERHVGVACLLSSADRSTMAGGNIDVFIMKFILGQRRK